MKQAIQITTQNKSKITHQISKEDSKPALDQQLISL